MEMVVERDHTRMIELRQRPHFPDEIAVTALGWTGKHLYRDLSVGNRRALGKKHLAEPAAETARDELLVIQSVAD